ncbi:hypothetical protein AN1V17_42080 [Vallitalea sediminicola]
MELLYIWVENYKDKFKKQGFNFSSTVKFKYENGKLHKKEFNHMEKYFNLDNEECKISSVTGIVGENGAGKSFLLRMIGKLMDGELYDDSLKSGVLMIIKCSNKIKVYNNGKGEFKNNKLDLENENIVVMDKSELIRMKVKNKVIHYSPSFNTDCELIIDKELCGNQIVKFINDTHSGPDEYYDELYNYDIVDDISTDNLLREKYLYKLTDKLGLYKQETYQSLDNDDKCKIADFVLNKKIDFNTDKFKKPTKMVFKVINSLTIFDDQKFYLDYIKVKKVLNVNQLVSLSYILRVFMKFFKDNDRNIQNIEYLINTFNQTKKITDKITLLYGCELKDEVNDQLNAKKNNVTVFLNKHQKIIQILNLLKDIKFEPNNKIIPKAYIKNKNIITRIKKFLDLPLFKESIQIQWMNEDNMSSGEYSALTMYSRISYSLKELTEQDNIIILLDEPDLYYHPSWKRHFINDFIQFIKAITKADFDYLSTIQIIVTTNEPYIISDLLKEDIIFLINRNGQCEVCDNDNFKQTFGTNIHTLLGSSFFMNNSTVGEFAKNKINNTITELTNIRKNLSKCLDNQLQIKEDEDYYKSLKELDMWERLSQNSTNDSKTILDEVVSKVEKEYSPFIDGIGEPIIRRVVKNLLDDISYMSMNFKINNIKSIKDEIHYHDKMLRMLKGLSK